MQMNKEEVIRANGINPWYVVPPPLLPPFPSPKPPTWRRVKLSADDMNRWLGVFNGVSAFNNSGMSLLDANLVCFGQSLVQDFGD